MRGCRAWILLTLCGAAPTLCGSTSLSHAQGAPSGPASAQPEELAPVMARRISSHLGVPVRIKKLRYELLTSRFVGQGVEVGPRKAPLLALGQVNIKPRFIPSGEGGQVIEQLRITGLTAALPAAWLSRPVPRSLGRGVLIKQGKILGTRITLRTGGGASVILRDVELTLSGLVVPAGVKSRTPLWRGAFTLTARRIDMEDISLTDVRIEGEFKKKKLAITLLSGKLAADGLGGNFKVKGHLGFNGRRLGALSLKGRAELRPGPEAAVSLHGSISLSGRSLDRVHLKVNLKSNRRVAPYRWSMKPAPLLQMRGRVGNRTLRGTLESWRLR